MPDEPELETSSTEGLKAIENTCDPGGLLRYRALAKKPGFNLEKNGVGYVLRNSRTSESIPLSNSAALAWNLLDDDFSLAEIAAEIQCTFRFRSSRIARHVADIVDHFVATGVAVPAPRESRANSRRIRVDMEDIDIFVINRAVDIDRMSRAEAQLDQAGLAYQRHEAVDKACIPDARMKSELTAEGYALFLKHGNKPHFGSMTPGGLACALSWKSLLETRMASGSGHALALEDDFLLCDDFKRKLSATLKKLPPDFDIIYLSWNQGGVTHAVRIDEHFDRLYNPIHGTGAVLINPRSIPHLLSIFPLTRQLDHDIPIKLIVENRIRAYKGYYQRTRLITNDNLGGTTTQL